MCVAILLSVLHLKSPTGIFKVKFNVILGYDGQKGGISLLRRIVREGGIRCFKNDMKLTDFK